MIYDFKCSKCENIQEDACRVDDRETHRPKCDKCGSSCAYTFTPSVAHVILKDGPSGSWPSKGERFKNHRRKQSEVMSKKQVDRYGPPKELTPNFQGQQTESWREAQNLAKKERGDASATTYEKRVSKEKKSFAV